MTWEAVRAIGQVVSAFAFVLAIVQIRHTRTDSRRALVQNRTKQFGLTDEEALTLHVEMLARWQGPAQTVLYADQLPQGQRAQFDRSLRAGSGEPAFLLWYGLQKPTLDPDAVRYVDNVLAQPEGTR